MKKYLILVIAVMLVMAGWFAGSMSRHPLPPENVLVRWPIDLKKVMKEVEHETGWDTEFDFASAMTPPGTWNSRCSLLVHPPGHADASKALAAVQLAIQDSLRARGFQVRPSNNTSCKVDCSYLYEKADIRGEISIKALMWQKGLMLVLSHHETSASPGVPQAPAAR